MGQLTKTNEYSGASFTYTSGSYSFSGNYRLDENNNLTELNFSGSKAQDASAMEPMMTNINGNVWNSASPEGQHVSINGIKVGDVAEVGAIVDDMIEDILDSVSAGEQE